MSEGRQVSLQTMSEKEWAEVTKIAIAMHSHGMYGGNQLKCAIGAFVQWIMQQEEDISIIEEFEPESGAYTH